MRVPSLRYLYKKGEDKQASKVMEGKMSHVDEAMLLYSRPVLDNLKKKSGQAHLHGIAKETKIGIKKILDIIPVLESSGFVEIVERDDITGNDLIKLSAKGLKLIT